MIPYLLFYLALLFFAALYKIDKRMIVLFFLVFTLFYSFGINIGPDWDSYNVYFEHMVEIQRLRDIPLLLPNEEARFEWGFHILTFVLTRLGNIYNLNILVFNTISFFVYLYTFNKLFKKDSLLLFTIFIIFYGNRLFLSTLRQNLSVCFFYASLIAFCYKEKKAYLFLFISLLFHTTSIIIIPIVLLKKIINHKRFFILILILFSTGILGLQIGFLLPKIVLTLFSSFVPTPIKRLISLLLYGFTKTPDLLSISQLIMIIILCFFINNEKKNTDELKMAYSLIVFSVFVKYHFTNVPMFTARLKYNFGIGYMFFIFSIIKTYKRNYIIRLFPILYSLFLSIYSFNVIREDRVCYVPYENYLIRSVQYSNKEDLLSREKLDKRLQIGRINKKKTKNNK